jgi:IclR family KDG regulon transcriptional repressor
MENTSRTVGKAIDILEIFLQKDGELRLSEVADLAGLDRATAYRLASTLVKRHFLHQVKKNGRYSLGLKMIDCGFAIRRNLKIVDLAYLYLGKVNSAEKVAVNLTILEEDKSILVEEIGISSKGQPMRTSLPKKLPLHATACGKVFLASMSAEERKAFFRRQTLTAFTQNTVTDIPKLEKELMTIRREGVAFDLENYRIGLWAAAAPVLGRNGEVIAAASLIIPPDRVDGTSLNRWALTIERCANELSDAIVQPN